MLVRIANKEDPDQMKKQSGMGLHCLFRHFGRQFAFDIIEHLP